jgi:hypothetical protein
MGKTRENQKNKRERFPRKLFGSLFDVRTEKKTPKAKDHKIPRFGDFDRWNDDSPSGE